MAGIDAAVSSFVADSFGVMLSPSGGFGSIGGVALSSAMVMDDVSIVCGEWRVAQGVPR